MPYRPPAPLPQPARIWWLPLPFVNTLFSSRHPWRVVQTPDQGVLNLGSMGCTPGLCAPEIMCLNERESILIIKSQGPPWPKTNYKPSAGPGAPKGIPFSPFWLKYWIHPVGFNPVAFSGMPNSAVGDPHRRSLKQTSRPASSFRLGILEEGLLRGRNLCFFRVCSSSH